MRDELAGLLEELAGAPVAPGLLDAPGAEPARKRPPLKDRAALWDLAVRLMRELGTEVDVAGDPSSAPAELPRRVRRRVDFGPSSR